MFRKNQKIILGVIIILLLGNLFWAINYFGGWKNGVQKHYEQIQKNNAEVSDFIKLLIIKVLRSDAEVSFEDRLKLEESVREFNDSKILEKWQNFVNANNESEGRKKLLDLLDGLVTKIQ